MTKGRETQGMSTGAHAAEARGRGRRGNPGFALLAALVVACAPPPPRSPPPPQALRCGVRLPGAELEPLEPGEPAVAGMPSEQAAAAARQFDRERWREAAVALAAVARGETSDDEGNRQIAQYRNAIALYHLGEYALAADVFQDIARHRNHIKFNETLLWISKLVDHVPSLIRALRFYTPAPAERFNNPQHRELFWKMAFLMGRERFERGEYGEAAGWFDKVTPRSPYHEPASDCLARIRGEKPGP